MSWPSNTIPANVALHVIRRGHARAACFFGERDRRAFLHLLGQCAERFEFGVHAYVLMGNHVHLMLSASGTNGVEALVATLCARYERHVSTAHERTGKLWEDEFEVSAIHVRRHLLACMRYIELNPVRANLVAQPGAYRWSSYRANALGHADPLVTPHPFYYALGRTAQARQGAYLRLFGRSPSPGARIPGARRTGPRAPSRPT